jgi:hypothetical protein
MLASSTKICFQVETLFKVGQKFWDCVYDDFHSFLHEPRASIAKYLSIVKALRTYVYEKAEPHLMSSTFFFLL